MKLNRNFIKYFIAKTKKSTKFCILTKNKFNPKKYSFDNLYKLIKKIDKNSDYHIIY